VARQTFRTVTEAEDWLTTEKVKVRSGEWVSPSAGNVTFGELARQWMASNPGKRESTLSRDEIALRLHILPALEHRRISSITPVNVQSLVTQWSEAQSPASTRRSYDVLRAVLNYAVRVDLLARTPCRGVQLPVVKLRHRHVVTPHEVEAIADAMPEEYSLMVWIGAVLGFRWGEVAGLKVRSIDVERSSISITEQVTRGAGGRTIIGPPKSRAGWRTVASPSELMELCSRQMERRNLRQGDVDSLLFANRAGGPLSYSHYRRRIWKPAVKAAGLDELGFHDLRRAAATALVTEMVDIKTAQVRLGHSDPRLTLAIYAQATTEADQIAASRLGAKFLGAKPQQVEQPPLNSPPSEIAHETRTSMSADAPAKGPDSP